MAVSLVGNSNYGYSVHTVLGADLLKSVAGASQIYSITYDLGWYSTYFDDPSDQYWINKGINYLDTRVFYLIFMI